VAAAAGKMAGAREKAAEERHSFKQPAMLTGGQLKPYQLDGVQWLASLFSQGSTTFSSKMKLFHHTLLLQ
jgi:SNF2 family DNA or RNA helicase